MANKFAKDALSSGGFTLDGIYTGTGARFEEDTHPVAKDSQEMVTDVVCVLELEDEGGNPLEHKLKVGSAEKFQIVDDGADYDGPAVNDKSRFGIFTASLDDAGCDMNRFYDEENEKGCFGKGMKGLRFEARPEEIPGKPSFNNGKGYAVTKVVRILEDAKPGKKAAGKGAAATAAPAAGKKAAKAAEPAEETAQEDVDEVQNSAAQEAVMAVLMAASPEKVKRAKLPSLVFAHITKEGSDDMKKHKSAISKKVASTDWMNSADMGHPWESNKSDVWVD